MKFEKYKLFWKANGSQKEIKLIKWNEEKEEYYTFVKEQVENGYHQISITSELMIGFITEVSSNRLINISKIELMEDDNEEIEELNYMVDECKENRGMFVKILDKLHYLEDESSIEIKRTYFTENISQNNYGMFYIQVNGLLGISGDGMKAIDRLKDYIRESINV